MILGSWNKTRNVSLRSLELDSILSGNVSSYQDSWRYKKIQFCIFPIQTWYQKELSRFYVLPLAWAEIQPDSALRWWGGRNPWSPCWDWPERSEQTAPVVPHCTSPAGWTKEWGRPYPICHSVAVPWIVQGCLPETIKRRTRVFFPFDSRTISLKDHVHCRKCLAVILWCIHDCNHFTLTLWLLPTWSRDGSKICWIQISQALMWD